MCNSAIKTSLGESDDKILFIGHKGWAIFHKDKLHGFIACAVKVFWRKGPVTISLRQSQYVKVVLIDLYCRLIFKNLFYMWGEVWQNYCNCEVTKNRLNVNGKKKMKRCKCHYQIGTNNAKGIRKFRVGQFISKVCTVTIFFEKMI